VEKTTVVKPCSGNPLHPGTSSREYDAGAKFPKLPARKISALASMLSVEDGIDVIRLGHQEQE
jgi:hypothetical protein